MLTPDMPRPDNNYPLRIRIFTRQIAVTTLLVLLTPGCSMQPVVEPEPYEEVLVHDDYIAVAGVRIMSVEYAMTVLADYTDRPLHVRGHLCATSDSLYRLLKHVFRTNSKKPLVSTWGHGDHARCDPATVPRIPGKH